MRIIKDARLLEDDWQLLRGPESTESLPAGRIIIPYPFWRQHRAELLERDAELGVYINGDDDLEGCAQELARFPLIAVDFLPFTDGRCYSYARLLRERFNFKGEIRAIGEVLCDQIYFMRRCGIDAFSLRQDQDVAAALEELAAFSVHYQAASDDPIPLYKRR